MQQTKLLLDGQGWYKFDTNDSFHEPLQVSGKATEGKGSYYNDVAAIGVGLLIICKEQDRCGIRAAFDAS